MKEKLTIGTRGSKLALVQTNMVQAELQKHFPQMQIEVVTIKTSGDIFKEANLADIGGKELFTREIDEALIKGEIDIAVHSLKDVPGVISPKQQIFATLPRADARDCLIGAESIDALPLRAKFGTSSPRRKAQLLHLRRDLQIEHFRGNVGTRVQKVRNGEVAATLLAIAGLNRLHLETEYHPLTVEEMLPAAGQGIIGIAALVANTKVIDICKRINHEQTFIAATAERSVLTTYAGNCHTPLAAYAEINGSNLKLTGLIADTEGERIFKTMNSGSVEDAEKLGYEIANRLLENSKVLT